MNKETTKYIDMLNSRGVPCTKMPRGMRQDECHLLWMLYEISSNNLDTQEERHRWLGYVEGVLTAKGILHN